MQCSWHPSNRGRFGHRDRCPLRRIPWAGEAEVKMMYPLAYIVKNTSKNWELGDTVDQILPLEPTGEPNSAYILILGFQPERQCIAGVSAILTVDLSLASLADQCILLSKYMLEYNL